jgi:hypothetical protein
MIEFIRSKQAGQPVKAGKGEQEAEQRGQPDGCPEAQHR